MKVLMRVCDEVLYVALTINQKQTIESRWQVEDKRKVGRSERKILALSGEDHRKISRKKVVGTSSRIDRLYLVRLSIGFVEKISIDIY